MRGILLSLLLIMPASLQAGEEMTICCFMEEPPQWRVEAETGFLMGINNPNDYQLAPQLFTFQFRPWPDGTWLKGWEFGGGLLLEPVIKGPENLLVAGMFTFGYSHQIGDSPFELFASMRGGPAVIDSTDDPNGQAQDLTFALQAAGGLRYKVTPRFDIALSLLYQHVSNAGMSEPQKKNVGLDAIGPALSIGWTF